jgi:hypothetical protein
MSSAVRYRIPDEPSPSKQEALIVDPLWPLFAQMLVGTWFALPWFLVNGISMGSPTRRREWLLIAASLSGSAVSAISLVYAFDSGRLRGVDPRYGLVLITILKLACAYGLYFMQQRPFELWRHFGGKPKNGLLLVIAASVFLRPEVSTALGNGILAIILA